MVLPKTSSKAVVAWPTGRSKHIHSKAQPTCLLLHLVGKTPLDLTESGQHKNEKYVAMHSTEKTSFICMPLLWLLEEVHSLLGYLCSIFRAKVRVAPPRQRNRSVMLQFHRIKQSERNHETEKD